MSRKTKIESSLEEFLRTNPLSTLDENEEAQFRINCPWGDKTLAIVFPEEEAEQDGLIKVLNRFELPHALSAIFHLDDERLEVLWTAYALKRHSEEVHTRRFSISWKGSTRDCEFSPATSETLLLAKHCFPISNSGSTDHRNIVSFHFYANNIQHPLLDKPMSFFVDCKGLSSDERLEFLRHLNAYMLYFDRRSPRVLIHTNIESRFVENSRHIEKQFPKEIMAREIDSNLLSFWTEAFSTNDRVMRFLLLYRIIEYASFSFLDGQVLREIRKELRKPSLPNSIDAVARNVADIIVRSKETEAIPRVQNLIEATIDLGRLWESVECNADYFKVDHEFDGGYCVKALLSGKCDFENWKPNAVRNTFDRLRQIRNALAHGKDGATRGTIRPTQENAESLVPWLNLLETIAGDAMFIGDNC